MDVTMDIEVEHQITQPEPQITIMETCYEEPPVEETYTTEEVQMRLQAQNQGQQQHQGSHSQFLRCQNSGQKNFQGNQNYNKSNYGSGYKSQYNKGNGQNYGNKPAYQGQHQPASNQAPMQQPRINFGMILPMKFGLEQFLEMTKVLKCIEDKYSKPQYNRHEPSKQGNYSNQENQQPNGLMQSTSQTSQHGQITQNMQIGNVSVEQMATSIGSNPDHLVEALEEVFGTPQSTEEQGTQEEETT